MPYPDYISHEDENEARLWALGNMYALITEKDPYEFLIDCNTYGFSNLQHVFAQHGMRWNHLIEHDVAAIIDLLPVRYFKPTYVWVGEYRQAHRIGYKAPQPVLVTGREMNQNTKEHLEQRKTEVEQYGISLWMDVLGYACYDEQNYFYRTQSWKDRSAAARYEWGYQCNICKATHRPLHVHHVSPIVSAHHFNFSNCFASSRLRVMCEDCHDRQHRMTVRSALNYGFHDATLEELNEEKGYLRKLKKVHDSLKVCKFCLAKGYFGT